MSRSSAKGADKTGARAKTLKRRQKSRGVALDSRHHKAIALVLDGKTDRETAREVGVTRETVNRWRRENPLFVCELNRQRHEAHYAARERLRSLGTKVADVLDKALDDGDTRVALVLLKRLDAETAPGGPTTIEDWINNEVDAVRTAVAFEGMGLFSHTLSPEAHNAGAVKERELRAKWLPSK